MDSNPHSPAPADPAEPAAASADASGNTDGAPLTDERPLLALRDACRAIALVSPSAEAPRASDTPLFSSLLREALLLQPEGIAGTAGGGDGSSGERSSLGGGEKLDDKEVVDLLTRLIAADELLDGCCEDDWAGDQGSREKTEKDAFPSEGDIGDLFGLMFGSRRGGGGGGGGSSGGDGDGDGEGDDATSKPTIFSINDVTDLGKLLPAAPRRVCQYPFRENDIVWICKQCQADETCVLCNDCFRDSNHEGHEVFFYHAQIPSGGCCDCGDPDAWDASGFCPRHGLNNVDPLKELPPGLITAGSKVFEGVKRFLVDIMTSVVQSFDLSQPWREEDGTPEMVAVIVHQNLLEDHGVDEALSAVVGITGDRASLIRRQLRVGSEEESEVLSVPVKEIDRLLGIARDLASRGLLVSVRTDKLEARLERTLGVLWLLHEVSTLSDGTCRLVCDMLDVPALVKLVEANSQLPKELSRGFHDLYLTLMADQPFKTRIAAAYVQALPVVTDKYIGGVGSADYASLFTLSVQFLNRSAFVKELVEKHGLLEILAQCLLATLAPACRKINDSADDDFVLDAMHPVMKHRRYTPVMADLKCVMNIEGVPQRFLRVCFSEWIKILRIVQKMPPQVRQEDIHVEHETREWMYAFNMSISLSSLFEFMLGWLREPMAENASIPPGFFSPKPQPITGQDEATPSQQQQQQEQPSLSPLELFRSTFEAVVLWHGGLPSTSSVSGTARVGALASALPMGAEASAIDGRRPAVDAVTATAVGGKGGIASARDEREVLPMYPGFPVSYGGFQRVSPLLSGKTFYTTLHRFFAAMFREACVSESREDDLRYLKDLMVNSPEVTTKIVDTGLHVLSFAAEIRSGMWRKNGQPMNDQLLNYAEPNFCKIFRDLDLVLVQSAGLAYGVNQLVNHALHRFHCFYWMFDEFNSMPQGPQVGATAGASATSSAGATALYTGDVNESGGVGDDMESEMDMQQEQQQQQFPSRRTTLDSEQQLSLGEEFLLLMILVVTEMPWAPDPLKGGDASSSGVAAPEPEPKPASGADISSASLKFGPSQPTPYKPGGAGSGRSRSLRVDSRVGRQLRRELVHRLASAPCPHSELQDTYYTTSQTETIDSELLEEILKDIATRRESSSSLEPGKFVLKPEVFAAEYDSTFFHLSLQAHQQAGEHRPPIKGPTPVAPPPPQAHPLFMQLRIDLLKDQALLRVVGQVLLGCVRKYPGRARDALLLRGLHLLTLAVHVMSDDATKGEGGSGVRRSDVDAFCSVILEAVVRPPAKLLLPSPAVRDEPAGLNAELGGLGVLQGDMGEIDLASLISGSEVNEGGFLVADSPFDAMSTGSRAAAAGGGDEAVEGGWDDAPVSVLQVLMDLKGTDWAQADKTISAGTDWLLERLSKMSVRCRDVIAPPAPIETQSISASSDSNGLSSKGAEGSGASTATTSATKAATMSSPLSMEERSKAARKRATEAVRQNAKKFMDLASQMYDEFDDGDDDDKEKVEKEGSMREETRRDDDVQSMLSSTGGGTGCTSPECIICREKTGRPLGYVGFGRRSRVLDVRVEQEKPRPGVHLQFCGHALHYTCFDGYYATMVQASDAHNSVALDVDAGEFHCPLCKAVCNLMVPAIPVEEGEFHRAGYEVAGGRVRRRLLKGSDEMDVSGDERQQQQSIGEAEAWETKAALALERICQEGSLPARSPAGVPSTPVSAQLPPPPASPGVISMEVSEDEGEALSSRVQPPFNPNVKEFLESVYEVSKGSSVAGASITSEELFLSGCRALTYSICSAAVVLSPLDTARQGGMKGASIGGGSRGEGEGNFAANASRLRYLRQVVVALRTAAGQEGIGDSVRRKLVASLRGEQTSDNTNQQEGEENILSNAAGEGKSGEESRGRAKDNYEDLEDLKRPLLLMRAVEMLVTAMVLLPPHGASEDAMHCVRAMCLVRVLQVLYCYQDEIRTKAEAARKGKGTPALAPDDDIRTGDFETTLSGGGVGGGKCSGNNVVGVSAGDVKALFLDEGEGIKPPAGFSEAEWVKATVAVNDFKRQREEGSGVAPSRLGAVLNAAAASAGASSDAGIIRRSSDPGGKVGGSKFPSRGRKDAALQVRAFAFDSDSDSRDRYTRVAAPHATAFLRAALLALSVCFHDRRAAAAENGMDDDGGDEGSGGGGMTGADGAPLPSADDAFEPLCRFFGFPASAEAMLSQPGLVEASLRWLSRSLDAESYKDWLPWDENRKPSMHIRLCDFPVPVEIDLVRLPHAYTELHAEVISRARGRGSHPAVCLVCGEILDAQGAGECTRHASMCGSGVGVFFLLQECRVLLIHRQRAAYFPSPYVDAYGERQRHHIKGRPLYLDERRYDVVRGLWVKHLVAHEVVQSRATSRQVIISNYY